MAVYQEKNKNKWTKDGRKWYFRCYYTDMYGNRKQKISKMYSSKKEAQNEESEFLVKIATNDETDLNISFESVFNEWLQYKKQFVKYTTFYKIKNNMENHILPIFKNYKLHSIKINNLLLWKENLKKNNCLCETSFNKTIGYFKELLEYARINYDFDIKVSNKLQKNKLTKTNIKTIDSYWNFWTFEEFNEFIKNVDNKLDNIMYNFLYYTGVRLGEMLALSWKNVDFSRKTIKIVDNLTWAEFKGYDVTDPKTKNSIRMIDLDDNLVDLLLKHYNNEKKIYGFNESMYVFGNIKYYSPTTFRRHFKNNLLKSNIKRITPHGFRHSHVSLLIHLGCDSRDVAERIGDTVQMIEKTYYHMFPEKKKNTVNLLNNLKNKR